MPYEISVIVPVYQQWHLVPKLLKAMEAQTLSHDRWELILVDNGSDVVPSLNGKMDWVKVEACSIPGSYAARNAGVKASRGRFLVFTDADCIPNESWLLEHLNRLLKKPESLVAGRVTVKPFHENKRNVYEAYDSVFGLPQERYVSNGYAVTANLAFSKKTFDMMDGFDERRFSGGDADFCRRATQAGTPLIFEPRAEVFHPARDSWKMIETKIKRVKGGQLRNGPIRKRMLYFFFGFMPPLLSLLKVAKSDALSGVYKVPVCFLLMQMWGMTMYHSVRILFGGSLERK